MARLAAIGALIAALALPAVASAAGPAHHCKTGAAAVRLDGHRGCASLGTLRRAAGTAPPSAARIDADMARALLRRAGVHVPAGVQRIALLRLARAAAMVTERAHAAARSGGPLAGGGTGAFDSLDPPPGQVGEGAAVTVTTPVTIGGHVVEAPATYATQQFSQRCPGVSGDVPGTVALRQSWTLPTPLPHRLRAVVDVSVDMVGTLTGHVGADGHLHDYDLVVDVVATVRGSVRGPAGLVHGGVVETTLRTRVVFVGLSLDAMPAAVAFDAQHIGSISLQTGGRRDLAEFRGDELFMPSAYLNAAVGGSMLMMGRAQAALKASEAVFYDQAACLRADFTPATLQDLAPASVNDIAVGVRSTVDDREESFDLTVEGSGGTVVPARAHVSRGAPSHLTLVPDRPPAGQRGTTSVHVSGTSVRGRLDARIGALVVEPVKAWGYRVALDASGTYGEDSGNTSAGQDIEHHFTTTFTSSSVWAEVVLPADGTRPRRPFYPGSSGALSGAATSSGTEQGAEELGSSYHCGAPLGNLNGDDPGDLRFTFLDTLDDLHPFSVTAAALLGVVPGTGTCSTSGPFFDAVPAAGGPGLNDLGPALVGQAVYTQADVGRPTFTSAVQAGTLKAPCGLGNDAFGNHCTHAVTWTGTVTFTKVSACAAAAGGGYVCRPL